MEIFRNAKKDRGDRLRKFIPRRAMNICLCEFMPNFKASCQTLELHCPPSSLMSPKRVVGCRGRSRYVEGCWGFPFLKIKKALFPNVHFRFEFILFPFCVLFLDFIYISSFNFYLYVPKACRCMVSKNKKQIPIFTTNSNCITRFHISHLLKYFCNK